MRTSLALLLLLAAAATAICLFPGALALDGNDAPNNATPLSPGLNGPFDIAPSGDNDWYSFSLFELSFVHMELNGSSGDSVMYLYDANLSQLAYDDDGGTGLWSRLDRNLPAGDYLVLVRDLGNSSTFYGYYFTFTVTPPTPLSEGLNGPYTVNSTLPQNWFSFNVSETSNVRLELNGSSGDPTLYLFDANQSQLAYDDDSGTGLFSRIVRQLTPGTYFARVQPLSSYGSVPDYYFTLERVSLAGPDGNGIRDNATVVFLGQNGPFDINPTGDLDWYLITFGSGGLAEFQTDGPSGSTLLSFYDQNGTWLSQDYTSGNGSFSLLDASVDPLTYYILVQQPYGTSTVYNYTLEIEMLATPPPDFNNDQGNATLVSVGQSGPYQLTRGDIDWYTFTTTEPGTLRAETNGPRGGAAVTLLDTDGFVLSYGSYTGNFSFEYASALVDTGTYYIEVQLPYGILATMEYNLTITFTPYTSLDGNDFRSTAQRLVQGLNGPFSIQPAADADWYFFDQVESGTATVLILGGAGQATIQLFNATGALLQGGTYGVQQVSSTLAPARYFVRLSSTYGYYTVASYYLNLTIPDTTAPVVAISGPSNGTQTSTGAVLVSGTTEPGARVWVDGQEVVADANGSYAAVVLVALGSNTVTVVSRDLAGNVAQSTVIVVGVDPYSALTSQLNQANAQLNLSRQQLADAQAAAAAAAAAAAQANLTAQQKQSQLDTTNGTLAAARSEADGQRGVALAGMALGAVAVAAAVGILLLSRRKVGQAPPAQVVTPVAPAAAPPVTVTVDTPKAPASPEAQPPKPPA